ncbi:MAG: dimethylsulfoniopropionate demethylase [Paracoccaceae bacterium]|nr:dimethylsulfoniopropionate demethylase [Paracoccaceae bacterium]
MAAELTMSRRIRRTAYTDKVEGVGVTGFSVVNHMILPKSFQSSIEEDYWHLKEHVQLWDVSCQRQIQIVGLDATRLVQLMTPRDIGAMKIGECLYVPIIDQNAGLINDPVLLKISSEKYWLSIADSDLLLYALGLTIGLKLNAVVSEADVWVLSIQGPKAEDLVADLFGSKIRKIGFFKFDWVNFKGTNQLLARSGYSRQGGFEIYLEGKYLGSDLWDLIWEAGQIYNIRPGAPNIIERVEGGLFSYGNEMTRDNNPLEIGLRKFCSLDGSIDYIGREALQKIASEGETQQLRGMIFDGPKCPTCAEPWPVLLNGEKIGQLTSGMYSPSLKANVAVGMIARDFWDYKGAVEINCLDSLKRNGIISAFPLK